MRTLVIGKIWPEPTSSAAGRRTLDLVESLAAVDWEVHFACAAQPSPYSADFASHPSVTSHRIQLNHESFDKWIADLAPDIVCFDRYMTEEQFGWRVEKALPDTLRIVDTSDLHLLREARHQSIKTGNPINLRNHVALREVASLYRSDLSLIISEYELDLLRSHFNLPESSLAYWPFFADGPDPSPKGFEDRRHFVMIGSFLHEPNWDATRYCQQDIWPLVRAEIPDAELHVYGSYTPEKAQQLHRPDLGFHIMGRADDARATLRDYRVSLAPLRFGAGLKGKLFDSMQTGTPCAASSIALEGICGELPWGGSPADTPQSFAATAATLYQSPSDWLQARDRGYHILRTRFAKKHWQGLLPKRLISALEQREENRSRNFVGQLLRHHAHRSTEYMSRWIQAKNSLQKEINL